jgi:quinoprotein glucose dehydrogenase
MLYVPSRTNPFVADLVAGDPAQTNLSYRAGTRAIIQGPQGLPLVKPPYGRITAIDLNRGEQKWMVANGDGPRNHPALKGLNVGPLGGAVPSSAIVTKTLLLVTEADQITPRTPPDSGGRKFKALDKATGNTLWEMQLEAGANGTPMTYMFNGKQYIVFAIGGTSHAAELVALALP